MGEIATWSAVKTKVGLGKDGNDCPTKAELLALSPTGTGESYVGLELSNASSYKDTEVVKLEDIHKVIWKYTFTLWTDTLNFSALGGEPTNEKPWFGATSTRTKYLDGVATSTVESVAYGHSGRPSWVTWADGIGWRATENLELTARSKTDGTLIQQDSGKTYTVKWYQEAASQSWSYGWSVSPTSMSFGATGGTKTFTVTSYKQELRNGHNYGNQIALTYTRANSGSVSGSGTSVTMGNNTSTSTRSGTVTLTQAETGKKLTVSCSQSAGYRSYSEITASGGAVTDIPASGGTRSSFSTMPSYSQTWGWNGSTTGGGTITSGASISYGTAVSAGSLGTTVKSRTRVGTLTGTLSLNGKTESVSVPVYQAANEFTGYTYGSWIVSLMASSYTISNTGGSVTLYPSASRPRYANYTSGSNTRDGSDSATPSLSTNGTPGFSLSGTTLRASENTSTSSRSIRIFADYDGASDYVDITQGGASVSYNYYFYWNGAGASEEYIRHAASGDTLSKTFISYKKKVINDSETSDTYDVGVNLSGTPSWSSVTVSGKTVSSKASENTEESSRSATVTVTQRESGKKLTLDITQNAASVSYNYYFYWNGAGASEEYIRHAASGDTLSKTFISYKKKVINDSETSDTYDVGVNLSGTPSWSSVTVSGKTVSSKASENTEESSRSATVTVTQRESGKKLTLDITQNAATIIYEYEFNLV